MNVFRNQLTLAALSCALCAAPVMAQGLPTEGPVSTTALINAHSKSNQPLNPADLRLEVNGHDAAIAAVQPVSKKGVELAVLIDDGLRGNFGVQLGDLQHFLSSLPPNVRVLVGYMQNGTVRSEGGFVAAQQAAGNVRIPLSSPGVSASPYFCLQDFVNHWPAQGDAARMVLMITNGVDPYNGSVSPLNQDSPYVQHAQDDAQRAGVAVYSIYYGDSGIRGGLANFSGQSYLQQVAEATGGQSFYIGRITPPSLKPYFDDMRAAIGESYLVSFEANGTHEKRDTLIHIKLKTSQDGMKLHVPDGVHPGLSETAHE